ncbi:MAG: methyltransferase domain-containing protein [Chloroflexaceae bacterium]|jgi:ubiquinone/menaquinone biosynthesis C-methylase UbiE|nr:methyltransferase domain-containing protein [Chloroflexaceae bacterium]
MERGEYQTMAAVELNHWWYGGMRAINAALLDSCYAGRRDLNILDAGCGTGGDGLFLRRYGTVVGMDLAAEAAELGWPRLPGRFSRGSVLALPFADNSFDLVTSFDVLYHRGVPDEGLALREVRRVLKPGGRLLIRLPAYNFLYSRHDAQVHTRRRYNASSAHQLLREAGFYPERWSYVLSLLFPLPLAQRLLERMRPAPSEPESAMGLPPKPLNQALRWPFALEAAWIGMGGRFPFGLSIVTLAHSGKHAVVHGSNQQQTLRNNGHYHGNLHNGSIARV